MLPHVDADDGDQSSGSLLKAFIKKKALVNCHLEWVLIGACGDLKTLRLLVESEPAPARALDGDRGGAHFRLELIKRTEVAVNRLEQDTLGLTAAIWRHVLKRCFSFQSPRNKSDSPARKWYG